MQVKPSAEPELSRCERRVLHLIADGLTTRQIAERLFVTPKTVENHRGSIIRKLQLDGSFNCLLRFALTNKASL